MGKEFEVETIERRASRHDFVAFPDYANLPTIFDRVKLLLDSGRSLTLVEYFVNGDPDPQLHIAAGLRLEEIDSRRRWHEDHAKRTRGFRFDFTRTRQFGLFVDARHDEGALALRFHQKQTATMIRIEGTGGGVDDHIEVRAWNEHGVQVVTRIQLEDRNASTATEMLGGPHAVMMGRGWVDPNDPAG
ncbi:hypothetical protein D2E76_16540 [Mycobacteroides abscessus]|uniref:Uncharacterized protein n=1 Tax=Mycobacteroides abscessus TaxID=36809 RepID=A0ABD7HM42_9MYCO|nr:hypothetical protein D2E76_16540 [Mycobacteroides abscessus]